VKIQIFYDNFKRVIGLIIWMKISWPS